MGHALHVAARNLGTDMIQIAIAAINFLCAAFVVAAVVGPIALFIAILRA